MNHRIGRIALIFMALMNIFVQIVQLVLNSDLEKHGVVKINHLQSYRPIFFGHVPSYSSHQYGCATLAIFLPLSSSISYTQQIICHIFTGTLPPSILQFVVCGPPLVTKPPPPINSSPSSKQTPQFISRFDQVDFLDHRL